uniref:Ig-like domain-containing protein n=1 Tax=Knipowitschia caucasica TaxID=637954 RepID=A0AAV2MGE6_KNICA
MLSGVYLLCAERSHLVPPCVSWRDQCEERDLCSRRETRGVVKCKRDRDSGGTEVCPRCVSPPPLNGSNLLDVTVDHVSCSRPSLSSPLRLRENPLWPEPDPDPDAPYTRDLEPALGQLTLVLSDSHAHHAHVSCSVRRPVEPAPLSWSTESQTAGAVTVGVTVGVTVAAALECEIDRETLQTLWQLVAYYYESAAVLERGEQRGNGSAATFRYSQVVNHDSPYFTELKGHMTASPPWLLQPRVALKLNRPQTTTKRLVLDFTTNITKTINTGSDHTDIPSSWALIRQGEKGRVQTALEGTKVELRCEVVTSDPSVQVEWMLPDGSLLESSNQNYEASASGELVVLNATIADSGLYQCLVRSSAGVDLMPFRLTVKPKSLSPKAINGETLELRRGGSFTLPCDVTSAQPSQTVWFLPNGHTLLPAQQNQHTQVLHNGTLVVKRVSAQNSGDYSCVASNLHGVDMIAHTVHVRTDKHKAKAQANTALTLLAAEEGSGADFQEIVRPIVNINHEFRDANDHSLSTNKSRHRRPTALSPLSKPETTAVRTQEKLETKTTPKSL